MAEVLELLLSQASRLPRQIGREALNIGTQQKTNGSRCSPMSEPGKGPDCFGLVGEDRIRILKPPWRRCYGENNGATAIAP